MYGLEGSRRCDIQGARMMVGAGHSGEYDDAFQLGNGPPFQVFCEVANDVGGNGRCGCRGGARPGDQEHRRGDAGFGTRPCGAAASSTGGEPRDLHGDDRATDVADHVGHVGGRRRGRPGCLAGRQPPVDGLSAVDRRGGWEPARSVPSAERLSVTRGGGLAVVRWNDVQSG